MKNAVTVGKSDVKEEDDMPQVKNIYKKSIVYICCESTRVYSGSFLLLSCRSVMMTGNNVYYSYDIL